MKTKIRFYIVGLFIIFFLFNTNSILAAVHYNNVENFNYNNFISRVFQIDQNMSSMDDSVLPMGLASYIKKNIREFDIPFGNVGLGDDNTEDADPDDTEVVDPNDEATNNVLPMLNLRWPVDFNNPQDLLSDGFGPRLKTSDNGRYDFHRGIDIPGSSSDEVVAIADGEVYRVYEEGESGSPYDEGGTVVVVKHEFDEPVQFHDEEVSYYYSIYMHLASMSVAEGDSISEGDVLGYIGDSGDTDFDHLHFEIRVGTTCSYEYSLAGSCGSVHNYDPHINPLTFLNYNQTNTVSVTETVAEDDLQLAVAMPRDEVDFNSIVLTTYDSSSNVLATKTLDLNMREGVDATSEASLDTDTYNNIYLEPEEFSNSENSWILNVDFIDSLSASVHSYSYQVQDVFGNILYSMHS